MEKFKGKNVLITGGASGIGGLMGAMALDKGAATLIIWDIIQENIDNTISEFSNKGKVIGHRVDVSNEQNVIDAAKTDAGNTSYCSI